MADYYTMSNGYVQRATDLALIPPTEENADYVQYLADVANGATVELFDYAAEAARQVAAAAVRTEIVVSRFQAHAALMQAGLLDDVEAYMSTADPFKQLAWDTVQEVREFSPMVAEVAPILNMTPEQLHNFFQFASTIYA